MQDLSNLFADVISHLKLDYFLNKKHKHEKKQQLVFIIIAVFLCYYKN